MCREGEQEVEFAPTPSKECFTPFPALWAVKRYDIILDLTLKYENTNYSTVKRVD
jgi:hypothetical protein